MYLPWDDLESSIYSSSRLTSEFVSLASVRLQGLLKSWARNYKYELRAFRPKVRLFIEKDSYVIKTAESSWELEAALKLRHDVFYQEMLQRPSAAGFDIDEFDLQCDHLVIMDTKTNCVIGTYRLNASAYTRSFYTAKEFRLDDFLRSPSPKLELGRACIQKEFRSGLVIALLWKGIVQYAERVGAERMFGCSSVQTTDPFQAVQMSAYMHHHEYAITDMNLDPRPNYRFPDWEQFRVRYERTDHESLVSARKSIPPLLLAYLRMGARVGPQPAIDRAFQCVDFLTILDTQKIAARSYERAV